MPKARTEAEILFRVRNPLRKWRIKHEWTQTQVADQIGSVQQTVQHWEVGRFQPPREQLTELADLMGMSPTALAGAWSRWMKGKPPEK